jgi:hypothetical protein
MAGDADDAKDASIEIEIHIARVKMREGVVMRVVR